MVEAGDTGSPVPSKDVYLGSNSIDLLKKDSYRGEKSDRNYK